MTINILKASMFSLSPMIYGKKIKTPSTKQPSINEEKYLLSIVGYTTLTLSPLDLT